MRFGSTKYRFTKIFHDFGWGEYDSKSGPGSSVSNTKEIREGLKHIIEQYNVKSILDIPAGDFNWMKKVDLSNVNYLGADIVKEIVDFNNDKFKQNNVNFIELDLIKDDLPDVDMIISRDCFIHFSFKNIFKSLKNIKKSDSRYLFVSTYPDVKENINIRTGYNFNINLQIAPFNLPDPILLIEEKSQSGPKHGRKCVGLWEVANIPTFIS
jgi:hypothetical protein